MTISLIILNWKRPANLQLIVDEMRRYPLIQQIIVMNNNSDAPFRWRGNGHVHTLNAHPMDWAGLNSRLGAATFADQHLVMFHDDDLITSNEAVVDLSGQVHQDPGRQYGTLGRVVGRGGIYAPRTRFGEVDIVLTRCCLFHRNALPFVIEKAHLFWGDSYNQIRNGEDIFLSFALRNWKGKKPLAIRDFGKKELPDPHPLYGRPEHRRERTEIVRRCQRFFR